MPLIDKAFPIDQVKQALDHLAQGCIRCEVVVPMR